MDILKKEMAPVTDKAWEEIKTEAKKVLNSNLTARKFVDINGPYGIDYGAVSTGRLTLPKESGEDDIHFGLREVQPLLEIRKPFELDLWELDNIERGARDVDLEPLEKAARQVADFEESVIYQGLRLAGIIGLEETSDHAAASLPGNKGDVPKYIGAQVNKLRMEGVEGPYTLVVSDVVWLELINQTGSYPLLSQLTKDVLGGNIIVQKCTDKSFLISERGGDFELTLGQDTTIGYNSHDARKVTLFFTASYTYRTLSPEAVIVFNAPSWQSKKG